MSRLYAIARSTWERAVYFVYDIQDHRVQIGRVVIIGKERQHRAEVSAFNLGREANAVERQAER